MAMTQVFSLAPGQGSTSSLWMALLILPVFGITAYLSMAPKLIRYEVSPNQLRIRGDLLYGRSLAISDLRLEESQSVDLTTSKEYRLTLRTNGTGLPGYKAGWFRTAGGRKALVFLRGLHEVVVIPHKEGYLLLLSPADPAAFMRSLQSAAAY